MRWIKSRNLQFKCHIDAAKFESFVKGKDYQEKLVAVNWFKI